MHHWSSSSGMVLLRASYITEREKSQVKTAGTEKFQRKWRLSTRVFTCI